MKRRDFLEKSSLLGVAGIVGGFAVVSCDVSNSSETSESEKTVEVVPPAERDLSEREAIYKVVEQDLKKLISQMNKFEGKDLTASTTHLKIPDQIAKVLRDKYFEANNPKSYEGVSIRNYTGSNNQVIFRGTFDIGAVNHTHFFEITASDVKNDSPLFKKIRTKLLTDYEKKIEGDNYKDELTKLTNIDIEAGNSYSKFVLEDFAVGMKVLMPNQLAAAIKNQNNFNPRDFDDVVRAMGADPDQISNNQPVAEFIVESWGINENQVSHQTSTSTTNSTSDKEGKAIGGFLIIAAGKSSSHTTGHSESVMNEEGRSEMKKRLHLDANRIYMTRENFEDFLPIMGWIENGDLQVRNSKKDNNVEIKLVSNYLVEEHSCKILKSLVDESKYESFDFNDLEHIKRSTGLTQESFIPFVIHEGSVPGKLSKISLQDLSEKGLYENFLEQSIVDFNNLAKAGVRKTPIRLGAPEMTDSVGDFLSENHENFLFTIYSNSNYSKVDSKYSASNYVEFRSFIEEKKISHGRGEFLFEGEIYLPEGMEELFSRGEYRLSEYLKKMGVDSSDFSLYGSSVSAFEFGVRGKVFIQPPGKDYIKVRDVFNPSYSVDVKDYADFVHKITANGIPTYTSKPSLEQSSDSTLINNQQDKELASGFDL